MNKLNYAKIIKYYLSIIYIILQKSAKLCNYVIVLYNNARINKKKSKYG